MGATGNLASSILVSCRQTMSGSFAASQSISLASRTFSELTFQLASFIALPHLRNGGAGYVAVCCRDTGFLGRCNHPFDLDDCDSWLRAAKEQTRQREWNRPGRIVNTGDNGLRSIQRLDRLLGGGL